MHPGSQPKKKVAPPPWESVWEPEQQHVAFLLQLGQRCKRRGCCAQVTLMNMPTSSKSGQCSDEVEDPLTRKLASGSTG